MAGKDEVENQGTDISKVLRIVGVTDQDHDIAMAGAQSKAKKELEKELGRGPTQAEVNNRAADLYITGFILPAVKQGRTITVEQAKITAYKKQIENVPDVRKKALDDALIPLMLKHGQIDLATFEDWKNRFNKHQDEIISTAISAKISPYQAMAGVASLGILFGGIAQMVGMAADKPEWAEFGTKTMAWSTQLAQKAGDEILKLDKEQKILRNIDRTPEGFDASMSEALKRQAAYAHYNKLTLLALMVDDPDQRAALLASAAKGMEIQCAKHPGMVCPESVRSVRGNNPGNLRPLGASEGFQTFATPEAGLKAMYDDLVTKISGKSGAMTSKLGKNYSPTLQNLITVWAPPTQNGKKENDTAAYIARVSKETGIKPDQVLQISDIPKLMPSMIVHEGGPEAVAYFKPTIDKMFGAVQATAPIAATPQQPQLQVVNIKTPGGKPLDLGIHFSKASAPLDLSGGTGDGMRGLNQSAAALSLDGDAGSFADGQNRNVQKTFVPIWPAPEPAGAHNR